MAILYTLIVDNPNPSTVEVFPPSMRDSTWLNTLIRTVQSIGFVITDGSSNLGSQFIIFDSETDLNNFLNTNRLTDPTMIADLTAWKTAHNIKYNTKAYSLTTTPVTLNPLI
jgi:hypothetical protein